MIPSKNKVLNASNNSSEQLLCRNQDGTETYTTPNSTDFDFREFSERLIQIAEQAGIGISSYPTIAVSRQVNNLSISGVNVTIVGHALGRNVMFGVSVTATTAQNANVTLTPSNFLQSDFFYLLRYALQSELGLGKDGYATSGGIGFTINNRTNNNASSYATITLRPSSENQIVLTFNALNSNTGDQFGTIPTNTFRMDYRMYIAF